MDSDTLVSALFQTRFLSSQGISTFGAEKDMSFKQMYEDVKVYIDQQWTNSDK